MAKESIKLIANNKKAYHDYFIEKVINMPPYEKRDDVYCAGCYRRASSFLSWAWNSSGRPQASSTSAPVRGWTNERPTA